MEARLEVPPTVVGPRVVVPGVATTVIPPVAGGPAVVAPGVAPVVAFPGVLVAFSSSVIPAVGAPIAYQPVLNRVPSPSGPVVIGPSPPIAGVIVDMRPGVLVPSIIVSLPSIASMAGLGYIAPGTIASPVYASAQAGGLIAAIAGTGTLRGATTVGVLGPRTILTAVVNSPTHPANTAPIIIFGLIR